VSARGQRTGPVGRKVDQQRAAEAVGFRPALALGIGGGLKAHGVIVTGNRGVIQRHPAGAPAIGISRHPFYGPSMLAHAADPRAAERLPRALASQIASHGAAGVEIWRASLDREPAAVEELHAVLSVDERERASRFYFDRDRDRYVVGRGVLRTLLGAYVGVPPERVRFDYGPQGKPRLAMTGPRFNVSHSGAVALYAFSKSGEVGVDVELFRPEFAREHIAERFFSPDEVATLRSLPDDAQPYAFLTCWTRKEAYIKARGQGLSLPLDRFDVSLHPDEPAALLRTAWSTDEPAQWRLTDLSDTASGYFAAVAIRDDDFGPLAFEPATEEST
jgi:4'-phosphopantetheinyl transferase